MTVSILVVKKPLADVGDTGDSGSIPESGRSPGEGNGNPLQYFCLGNSMDRGTWWAPVHGGLKELNTTDHVYALNQVCNHWKIVNW